MPLDLPPDSLILYDPQLSPGNIRLLKYTPGWAMARFTATTEYITLQIQPLDKPGMYRLKPQQPLNPGFYGIAGIGPTSMGNTNGFFSGLCVHCLLDQTRASLERVKTEEAARLKLATIPSKTLAQMPIAFWYGPWPLAIRWNVAVTDTNITWTDTQFGITTTLRYSEIQSVDVVEAHGPWGGILCLNLPPNVINCNKTIQVSTVIALEEVPKLRKIEQTTKAALSAWKEKYPHGLPYAVAEPTK